MQRIHARKPSSVAVIVIAALLLAVAATAALAGRTNAPSGVAAAPQGTLATCRLIGPRQGLELNTVAFATFFKTIAMEKELFNCGVNGQVSQQRDVETFIELVENLKGGLVGGPSFWLTTCISNPPTGVVSCKNTKPPLQPVNSTPLKGCQPASFAYPDDPVEMTSAVNSGVVKTIKVDKSWYTCDTSAGVVIRDIYVFTETLEARTTISGTNTATVAPFLQKSFGIVCTKVESRATITGCAPFRTQ
jgi:hypothetical protein